MSWLPGLESKRLASGETANREPAEWAGRKPGDTTGKQPGDLTTLKRVGDLVILRLLLERLPKEHRLGTNLFLLVMGVAILAVGDDKKGESTGPGLLKAILVVREANCPGVRQFREGLYLV